MEYSILILFYIIILSTIPLLIYGVRNYVIVLEQCNCTVNPKYANPPTCYIDNTAKPHKAFIDIQMHHELNKIRYSLDITLIKNKIERYPVIQLHNNEGCKLFEGKIPMILLRSVREMVIAAGKLPRKCPVEKNFHFLYKELLFDVEKLPPMIPVGEYDILFNTTQGEDYVIAMTIRAKILAKPKG